MTFYGIKDFVTNHIGYRSFDNLLSLRKKLRRFSFRASNLINPTKIQRDDLVSAFSELGIGRGDNLFFQSAMSKMGFIEGGAETVIDALLSIIGPEGILAMPAFPIIGRTEHYLRRATVFDVRETPSQMGEISEKFRKMEGVYRSIHPTHSICARGNKAREFVAGHEKTRTAFSDGSPFARMIDLNFRQVWFGTGIRVFTLAHLFEDHYTSSFPLQTYCDERFLVDCVKEDGRMVKVDTPAHNHAVQKHFIYRSRKKQKQIYDLFLFSGIMKVCRLGRSEILSVNIRDMMTELSGLLDQGVTLYDIKYPKDPYLLDGG